MSEYKEIYSFSKPWYVQRFDVSREFDGGIYSFAITYSNEVESVQIKLVGPDYEDCIVNILQSDRLVVSKELGCQREFGSIRIECFSDDGYSEFWCDAVK